MCGRYSNTTPQSEFEARMAQALRVSGTGADNLFERFNVAPTQEVPAVVDDGAGRRVEGLRWGLVPHWAGGERPDFSMINARAETVLERPAYRDLVERARHRCLVLADGWYEWLKAEDPRLRRRPVHYSLAGGEPFCFAGLWTAARGPDGGEPVRSCTIVTCEANEIARPVHDRMPVVLADPERWDAWLDPAVDGPAARELLVPLESERMRVRPANPLVNSVANDGPGCLEPELTLL